METPADFQAATVMVQGPPAVLDTELLAVCPASAHSMLANFASCTATTSAWVLPNYSLAPDQAFALQVSKAHRPSLQCVLLMADSEPSSAHEKVGPSGLGDFLAILSLIVPGVV